MEQRTLLDTGFSPALAEGTYELRARLSAAAGNTAVSATDSLQMDPHASLLGSPELVRLHDAFLQATAGSSTGRAPASFFTLRQQVYQFDAFQRVLVNVRGAWAHDLERLQASLQGLGMHVTLVAAQQNLVIGYLPIHKILDLPHLPNYAAATPVYRPVLRSGIATTQGDAVLQADRLRQQLGVDGTGVTVGVISDSVNRYQGGLADSQRTGDLPPDVLVLWDGNAVGDTDEGRAMLEIIHDLAPGARLAFASADNGPLALAQAILALAQAGAQVIVDDVSFGVEPFFNDGVVAQAVDQVTRAGVFYVTAAGNDTDDAWTAPWRGTSRTVAGISGTFTAIDGGGDVLQDFTLPPGRTLNLTLQWDAAFLEGGSPLPHFQVPNDLEVLVTDSSGRQLLARFDQKNRQTAMAFEQVIFTNDGSWGTNRFALAFRLVSGPAPTVLKWIAFTGKGFADPQAQGQGAPTIYGHVAAKGAVAVGVVSWYAPNTPEPYSSLGGLLPIYFDAQGQRLTRPEVRLKPDLIAPANGNTSFFPPGGDIPQDSDTFPNFPGTSAAAPHLAAVAALLLQQAPGTRPAQLLGHLRSTARDLGAPGIDPITGFGLVQVQPIPGTGPGQASAAARHLVTRLYQNLLHRAPQAGEDVDWARALDAGSSPEEVARGFTYSDEYRSNAIRAHYRALLGREAEAEGVAGWLERLRTGLTEQQLLALILGSPEFDHQQGGTDATWLTGVYRVVLRRTPDTAGLAFWSQALQAGAPRAAIAHLILLSAEGQATVVQDIYQALLRRRADAAGAEFWTTRLQQGETPAAVVAALAGSAEYMFS
ncbi:MAG: DUF4214 domain-containing protein [Gemmataceae bacterium]|nr:DUF4214 domain-containing protein [Gemmataceae bacterium]